MAPRRDEFVIPAGARIGYPAASRSLLADRERYRWIEHGDGPPVVFLSGIFGASGDWQPMLQALDPRWRGIVPEIPLFGPGIRKPSIAAIVRHVVGFLRELRLASVVLGGNSLGGQVAIELAVQRPELVRGLILAGSSGLGEQRIGKVSHRPSMAYVRSQVAHVIDYPELVSPERVASIASILATPAGVVRALAFSRASRVEGIESRLADVRGPVLLVWGENDRVTPVDVARRFRGALRRSQLVLIPKAAHAPMLEQPQAFAAVTSSWLRSTDFGTRIADARSA